MEFLVEWAIYWLAIIFALAIDNVFWIPKICIRWRGQVCCSGSPEWETLWPGMTWRQRAWWVFRWRFVHVLLNPIDHAAAITGGLLLAAVL